MIMNSIDVVDFLGESNNIENVWDGDSLAQAIFAWEYIIGETELTPKAILKTHKILMLHQKLMPDKKGYFRKVPVWVDSREGLDWEIIPVAIKQWCLSVTDLIVNGQNESKIYLERMINEQHIKYEKIHPFIDGNGRTGRIFLNWTRVKLTLPILIIKEKEKQAYYNWFK